MEGMDAESLHAVGKLIKTKVKATLNNEVKAALLDEKHRDLLAKLNCEQKRWRGLFQHIQMKKDKREQMLSIDSPSGVNINIG
jgi:hypothetical protein